MANYTATETLFWDAADRDERMAELYREQLLTEVYYTVNRYVSGCECAGMITSAIMIGELNDRLFAGDVSALRRMIMHYPAFSEWLGRQEPDLIGMIATVCGKLYRDL